MLDYLQDRLQSYTIQSLTDGSGEDAIIEATEKYERLVGSAISTLRYLIGTYALY